MNTEDVLASTYEDTCQVYRKGALVKDEDTKQSTQKDQLTIPNVSCALSQGSGGGIRFGSLHASTQSNDTLFCRPGVPIRAGDRLEITQKGGQTHTMWAGKPFVYAGSHQEVPLLQEKPT